MDGCSLIQRVTLDWELLERDTLTASLPVPCPGQRYPEKQFDPLAVNAALYIVDWPAISPRETRYADNGRFDIREHISEAVGRSIQR